MQLKNYNVYSNSNVTIVSVHISCSPQGFTKNTTKIHECLARSIFFDKKQQLINKQELEDSFLFLDWVISVSGMAAGLKIWRGGGASSNVVGIICPSWLR